MDKNVCLHYFYLIISPEFYLRHLTHCGIRQNKSVFNEIFNAVIS
jgi:hypothetical protein